MYVSTWRESVLQNNELVTKSQLLYTWSTSRAPKLENYTKAIINMCVVATQLKRILAIKFALCIDSIR